MKEQINDWRPEVGALLNRLESAGVRILAGNNGEDEDEFDFPLVSSVGPRQEFIDNLIACDEARLYVQVNGVRKWLYLVLGNSPGELVCDYVVDPVLDTVTDAHYAEWIEKKQPKRDSPYVTGLLVAALLCLSAGAVKADCCPQPPPGYDCYPESPAILPVSGQIHFDWTQGTTDEFVGLTHVTEYLSFQHPESTGFTYEVQYTDDLGSGVWKAYARWTAANTDTITTDTPVYPCIAQRFFRICVQASPAPSLRPLFHFVNR